jgi:predicted TIM-barrel fold metal-dependent hydrolase
VRLPAWASRSDIGRDFWMHGRCADCPVIDAHGHLGSWKGISFPCSEPSAMVARMDRAGVEKVVFSHHAALSSPDTMNRHAVEAVRAHPDRLRAYCVYNPGCRKISEAELAALDRFPDVFAGLKLHGDMHGVPYTDPRYDPAWQCANERGLPVLVHSWGDSANDGTAVMRAIAERYPRVPILLGHSLHNQWNAAIAIARDFPSVLLDLCAVMDERTGVLERFVGEVGSERVLFGTDIPWFDFHYYIAGVVAADITDEDRRNILHRNARRLFGFEGEGGAP